MQEKGYKGDTVEDWMSKSVVSMGSGKTALEATKIMTEKKIGSIIVNQNGILQTGKKSIVGIVTETDIVRRLFAQKKSPEKARLSEIMTSKPIVLESSASIIQASNILIQNNIKRIPITKKGVLEGIFTITDLMSALVKLGKIYEVGELVKYIAKKKIGAKKFEDIVKVEKWMASDVITCERDKAIVEVARMMDSYKVGDIVVMEAEKILGIITDTDIVRRVCAKGLNPDNTLVKDVMSTPVICAKKGTTLIEAAEIMHDNIIKRIIIKDEDKLEGLLSVTDLADALIQLNNFAQAHKIIDMLYEK